MNAQTRWSLTAILVLIMSRAGALAAGYTGGDGASYVMGSLTNVFHLGGPLVTLSSAANQVFTRGYAPAAISTLTITAGSNAPGISNGTPIAVWIPAGYAMTWDATNVTATVGGPAAGKVSATVSYTGASQRLLIAVTSNFSTGEYVTVSALAFNNFLGSGSAQLQLDYDNDGVADAQDDKQITIAGFFAGGDGAHYFLDQTPTGKALHPVGTLMTIARLGLCLPNPADVGYARNPR